MKPFPLLLTLASLFASGAAFSQSPLPVGQAQLNIGFGLTGWGIPVYIGLDGSVHKDITIGGEVSFRAYRENWKNNFYKHSIIGLSANANYHFNSLFGISPKWDLYAGLNLGFYVWSSPNAYDGNHSSGLGLGGQVGGRYYITNKLGLNLEFGSGNAFSGGKFGLSVKL